MEVWRYLKSTPGFAVGMGSGSRIGRGVGLGTGVTVGEPARSEDRAVIYFEGGKVIRMETEIPALSRRAWAVTSGRRRPGNRGRPARRHGGDVAP